MHKTVDDHNSRKGEIEARLAEIDAEFAGAALTEDVRSEWNDLNEERENLVKLIEELHARDARVKEIADKPEHTERASFNVASRKEDRDIYDLTAVRNESRNDDDMVDKLRDNALRSVERLHSPTSVRGASKESVQERVASLVEGDYSGEMSKLILRTGSPTYNRAFGKHLAGGQLTNEERTALTTGTTLGTVAVPYQLDPTVILANAGAANPFRSACRVVSLTGANQWKGVSSAGMTAAYISEGTEETDHSPTFSNPSTTVQRAGAFVPFSIELEEDWSSLQETLTVLTADAKNTLEVQAFTTGTGTAPQPLGILGIGFTGGITTAQKVASITTAAFAIGDVYALEGALSPRYRQRASIMANRSVLNSIRQFDTAGGAGLWVNNLSEGLLNGNNGVLSQNLLGYPTFENSVMSSTPATSSASTMLMGDFSQFVIVDRVGMTVEIVPTLFGSSNRFPTGQRGFFAYWRNNTVVTNTAAFVYLSIK